MAQVEVSTFAGFALQVRIRVGYFCWWWIWIEERPVWAIVAEQMYEDPAKHDAVMFQRHLAYETYVETGIGSGECR